MKLNSITFDFSTDDTIMQVTYTTLRTGWMVKVVINGDIMTNKPTYIGGQKHYAEAELNYALSKIKIASEL